MHDLKETELSETAFSVLPSPHYIVLQASEEKDQISSVDKVVLFQDKIYVADKFLKKLMVYDLTGRLQKSIGEKGHGPGEYIDIADFSVDPQGNVYILDNQALALLKYDSIGNYKESQKLAFRTDAFQCLSNGNFLFSLSSLNKEDYKNDQLLLTNKDLKSIKKLQKYNSPTDENFRLSGFGFHKTAKGIFYHKPIDDRVYCIDEDGNLTDVFYFDFGERSVPDADKKNVENKIENKFTNYTTLTYFTIVGKNHIYLSLFDRGNYKQAVVDTKQNIIYTKSDETIDQYGHFIACSDIYLISYIPNIFEGNIPESFPLELISALKQGNHILGLYNIEKDL